MPELQQPGGGVRRFLVVGAGSIGRRHVRNLLATGECQVRVVDPDRAALQRLVEEVAVTGSQHLEEGLSWPPDVVFVTNPTVSHVPTATAAARRGCHLFIEKPLAATLDGCAELTGIVERHDLVALVGCNMRFHAGPATVRQVLQAGNLGRVLCARLEVGSYLPDWRPGTDYRMSYSARAEEGGGCILDAIHEIDLACWMFGFPVQVRATSATVASLGITTEALAELTLVYADGCIVSLHLDYVQRWRQRRCEVIAEHGTVAWESRRQEVSLFRAATGTVERIADLAACDPNDMYMKELRHFLQCVERTELPALPIAVAAREVELALAAKRSAATGEAVALCSR